MTDANVSRSPDDAQLAIYLASAIIQAKGGEWSVDQAIDLVEKVRQRIIVVLGAGKQQLVRRPAVPIEESIKPNCLVCLEDGKELKLLKRYLWTNYKLTPEAYRQKWGLPADYPMAAPNYSRARSDMARRIGLGKQKKAA